jgi:hypothetical protein
LVFVFIFVTIHLKGLNEMGHPLQSPKVAWLYHLQPPRVAPRQQVGLLS